MTSPSEAIDSLREGKRLRRLELARLPIERKIALVVELQRLENDIREKTGRPPRREWILETTRKAPKTA